MRLCIQSKRAENHCHKSVCWYVFVLTWEYMKLNWFARFRCLLAFIPVCILWRLNFMLCSTACSFCCLRTHKSPLLLQYQDVTKDVLATSECTLKRNSEILWVCKHMCHFLFLCYYSYFARDCMSILVLADCILLKHFPFSPEHANVSTYDVFST